MAGSEIGNPGLEHDDEPQNTSVIKAELAKRALYVRGEASAEAFGETNTPSYRRPEPKKEHDYGPDN